MYSTVVSGELADNESVIPVNPTLDNVVAYYKFEDQVTVNGNVVNDELGVNNGSFMGYGTGDNKIGDGLFGSNYYNFDRNKSGATVVIDNPTNLSFSDGNEDKPFSVSVWFKLYGDGMTYSFVKKGDL